MQRIACRRELVCIPLVVTAGHILECQLEDIVYRSEGWLKIVYRINSHVDST
jgi:hypothetical protein